MAMVFLLADDDEDDRDFFCEILRRIDPSIICYYAEDGVQALDVLKEEAVKPDIIFLDINMPRINGWQCLNEIKTLNPYKNIPVVIYSTSTYKRDINRALELGAFAFFAKPMNPMDLKDVLTTIINNWSGYLSQALSDYPGIYLTVQE